MEPRIVNQSSGLSGQTIRGYTLKELLGTGQLTEVYRVRKDDEEATHILTIIIPPGHLSESARERFLLRFDQEAARLLSLKHPHIFPLEGWGQQAGYPYLLMPDVQGKSLASVLRSYGRCSLSYAVAVLERVAETLEYAHDHGVLHLGLSPARIFLHQDLFIQVAGFGLVRLLERRGIEEVPDDPYNALKSVAGTFFDPPEYLAPEVVQGQIADARADVYALGILLYEMLCGRPPFTGDDYLNIALQHVKRPLPPLHGLCPDIPLALELVIHQALKRDPNQRFQRPRDLANACMRVLTRRPFALVSLDQSATEAIAQRKELSEQSANIAEEMQEDSKELELDLLRIWQASKARMAYLEEPLSRHAGKARNEEQPGRPAISPRSSPASSPSTQGQRKVDRNTSFPSIPAKQQSISALSEEEPKALKKPSSLPPQAQPESKHITALFAALENLPRPTYEAEGNDRLLIPVPDLPSSEGPNALRSSLEDALTELLPALPLSSILRRRRRFAQMFQQRYSQR